MVHHSLCQMFWTNPSTVSELCLSKTFIQYSISDNNSYVLVKPHSLTLILKCIGYQEKIKLKVKSEYS